MTLTQWRKKCECTRSSSPVRALGETGIFLCMTTGTSPGFLRSLLCGTLSGPGQFFWHWFKTTGLLTDYSWWLNFVKEVFIAGQPVIHGSFGKEVSSSYQMRPLTKVLVSLQIPNESNLIDFLEFSLTLLMNYGLLIMSYFWQ